MKNILLAVVLLCSINNLFAQGGVNGNSVQQGGSPGADAAPEVVTISTVTGQTPFTNPPALPNEGDEYLNSNDGLAWIRDNGVWVARPGSSFSAPNEDVCIEFNERIVVKKIDGSYASRPTGSIQRKEVSPVGDYAVLANDEIVFAAGGSTITLPDVANVCNEVTIYRDACTDGFITVVPPAGTLIDGIHASRLLEVGRGAFTYEVVNSTWRIKSEFFEPGQECAAFSLLNSTTSNITVFTSDGLPYSVEWGDGTNSGLIASGVAASKSYATAFTGDIRICKTCGTEAVNRVTFQTGNWNFNIGDLNQLPNIARTDILTGVTSGDIDNLPNSLNWIRILGNTTVNGNLADLPPNLTVFNATGNNTTTGLINDLPTGLTNYSNTGNNTTSGDILFLPAGLTFFQSTGSNTITGDMANLPTGLTYYENTGQNTTFGNISNLPVGLTVYSNAGQNTTTGDIDNLPAGLTFYANAGQNTVFGDLGGLPAGITFLNIGGLNVITGNVAGLPAGITFLSLTGQNTVSGNISDLPIGVNFIQLSGLGSANNYTGDAFSNNLTRFESDSPNANFDATEVDNLFIALAATLPGVIYTRIVGGAAAPTAASLTARNNIIAAGGTVITN